MVNHAAPKDNKGRLNTAAAKEAFLERLALGESVAAAVRHVQRSEDGYRHWKRTDKDFAKQCDTIIGRRQDGTVYEVPDFPEFCAEYLHQPLFEHQLNWFDILEGREPRWMHESFNYSKGDPQIILCNVPPGFAKSTTITVNYVVWRICKDPNVRVVIISATEKMAKKFLYAVKQRLVNPAYSDLQRKFAPQGGYRATAESWTATEIYLSGKDDGEKDPTVQAIGMGGQIYGARADLIVADDVVTLRNAHDFEDQIDWLTQEVVTRLPELEPDAKLLVVGTRVAPVDLYQQMRDNFRDGEDQAVCTYLSMPAVLEYGETPEDWVTLWPFTADRDGTLVPKWTGEALASRRNKVRPRIWAMVYQQLDITEDAVFNSELVQASVQMERRPGPLFPGARHWERDRGMSGLYVVAGLDPATAGHTAAMVLGVDRQAKRMYLLDAYNRSGILPREMRRLIEDWTIRYGINEWRIEENGFQRSIVQDDDLRAFLFSRGVVLKPHWTGGKNKADPDFGVASMATLFEPMADGRPQLLLPNNNSQHPAVAALTEQLISWQPQVKGPKTDCVMALWFAVIRARELIFQAPQQRRTHLNNTFLSKTRSLRERHVVDLEALQYERLYGDAS